MNSKSVIEVGILENSISFFEKDDYEKVKRLLAEKDSKACEDCLLGLFVWKERYGLELLEKAGGYILHSKLDDSFLFPMPIDKSVNILKECLNTNKSVIIRRVTESQRKIIDDNFPEYFRFEEDEGSFDYLYDVEALAELRGKKLSKKRNHINSFLTSYDNWLVEPITSKNVEECIDFAKDWYIAKESKVEEGISSLQYERESMLRVLDKFSDLEADGILLRIEGKCLAFTVGQCISTHTYDVVFEKADEQIRGAYNIINREFVRHLRRKYPKLKYINRENDLNLPGLRKAKNSYMPCELLKKYNAYSVQ